MAHQRTLHNSSPISNCESLEEESELLGGSQNITRVNAADSQYTHVDSTAASIMIAAYHPIPYQPKYECSQITNSSTQSPKEVLTTHTTITQHPPSSACKSPGIQHENPDNIMSCDNNTVSTPDAERMVFPADASFAALLMSTIQKILFTQMPPLNADASSDSSSSVFPQCLGDPRLVSLSYNTMLSSFRSSSGSSFHLTTSEAAVMLRRLSLLYTVINFARDRFSQTDSLTKEKFVSTLMLHQLFVLAAHGRAFVMHRNELEVIVLLLAVLGYIQMGRNTICTSSRLHDAAFIRTVFTTVPQTSALPRSPVASFYMQLGRSAADIFSTASSKLPTSIYVPTGIRELDQALGGGLPAGAIVEICNTPNTSGQCISSISRFCWQAAAASSVSTLIVPCEPQHYCLQNGTSLAPLLRGVAYSVFQHLSSTNASQPDPQSFRKALSKIYFARGTYQPRSTFEETACKAVSSLPILHLTNLLESEEEQQQLWNLCRGQRTRLLIIDGWSTLCRVSMISSASEPIQSSLKKRVREPYGRNDLSSSYSISRKYDNHNIFEMSGKYNTATRMKNVLMQRFLSKLKEVCHELGMAAMLLNNSPQSDSNSMSAATIKLSVESTILSDSYHASHSISIDKSPVCRQMTFLAPQLHWYPASLLNAWGRSDSIALHRIAGDGQVSDLSVLLQ